MDMPLIPRGEVQMPLRESGRECFSYNVTMKYKQGNTVKAKYQQQRTSTIRL